VRTFFVSAHDVEKPPVHLDQGWLWKRWIWGSGTDGVLFSDFFVGSGAETIHILGDKGEGRVWGDVIPK
jgi:hypothetical protein